MTKKDLKEYNEELIDLLWEVVGIANDGNVPIDEYLHDNESWQKFYND